MLEKTEETDLTIAQATIGEPIDQIAKKLHMKADALFRYGEYIAKIDPKKIAINDNKKGKLILVTAMSPTTAGEGKTTMSIGLADSMNRVQPDKVAALALREPSMGPVFGMKGGATGGGHAQVIPMETINLHFTGDIHAIGAAGNLLAAMIDNHLYQGNELGIDPTTITWKRSVDMNDRQLRQIESGLGSKFNGKPRQDGFEITVASEVMATLCLASDLMDLKRRLAAITIGFTYDGKRVSAGELHAEEAMAIILKDAINPNLVQTLEGTPVLMHGGPFANIAHGCNSVIATKMGLQLADYVITEAGFGSDLGAEKFLNIKMRQADLFPDSTVLVGTIRALKLHAGIAEDELAEENVEAVLAGVPNLLHHYQQLEKNFGLKSHVVLNLFPLDTDAEIEAVIAALSAKNIDISISSAWRDGGAGSIDLAKLIIDELENEKDNAPQFVYELDEPIEVKIRKVVRQVYGGSDVTFSDKAKNKIVNFQKESCLGKLPICIAKTQYSLTDKPKIKNVPTEPFTVHVRDVKLATGAGFIIVTIGNIVTMPGLPKTPAAVGMEILKDGTIKGLY